MWASRSAWKIATLATWRPRVQKPPMMRGREIPAGPLPISFQLVPFNCNTYQDGPHILFNFIRFGSMIKVGSIQVLIAC